MTHSFNLLPNIEALCHESNACRLVTFVDDDEMPWMVVPHDDGTEPMRIWQNPDGRVWWEQGSHEFGTRLVPEELQTPGEAVRHVRSFIHGLDESGADDNNKKEIPMTNPNAAPPVTQMEREAAVDVVRHAIAAPITELFQVSVDPVALASLLRAMLVTSQTMAIAVTDIINGTTPPPPDFDPEAWLAEQLQDDSL